MEVQDAAVQHDLNKSQTRALAKLNAASESEFQGLVGPQPSGNRALSDFSATEIEAIANKEIQKRALAEQAESRSMSSLSAEAKVLLQARLGIPDERIAERLKINRKTVAKHCERPKLFRSIRDSLGKGLSASEAAKKWCCPEPLVWSIELEGKSDPSRFKALNWGLRTWDLWNWNDCDKRFGDDWPGRIPAQMIAHILYYFSDQGDLIIDPMAGGGVVADTCLAFNRKCWSFDMADRPDTRPEIEPYFWDFSDLKWPVAGRTKPDLIIFDPPYFKKQASNYDQDAISGLAREEYLEFLENLFALAHRNAKRSTQMAFINADWRDFQNTPARNEMTGHSIMIDDYLHIIKRSGWQRSHIMQAPLSSERFNAGVVSAMQKKRIVGVTSRYVIISSRK
jgi:DNA modification methylase